LERVQFKEIADDIQFVSRRATKDYNIGNRSGKKVIFEVLQLSSLANKRDIVMDVAEFYDVNWLGNKDFMHSPNFETTLENCRSYPIIIAREEGSNEILAGAIIKYDKNNGKTNPYFPVKHAKYLSITGILSKKDTNYKGLGKKIYEIGLVGASRYTEKHPETKMMIEIDCRNKPSFYALRRALNSIRQKNLVGTEHELPAKIAGYYEIINDEGDMVEAPTLVLEVELASKQIDNSQEENFLSFSREKGVPLFVSLRKTLHSRLESCGLSATVEGKDGANTVRYYPLDDPAKCSIIKTRIRRNGTDLGNDRIPTGEHGRGFIGPMPRISLNDDYTREE